VAEGRGERPWVRWAATAALAIVALGGAVAAAVHAGQDRQLTADGTEIVAEVVGVERPQRPIVEHDEVEVAFTTRDGEEIHAIVSTQQQVDLDVIRVRYDPSDPRRVQAVEDPVPEWWEEIGIAALLGLGALLVGSYPRLLRLRERLNGEEDQATT
jgi:hypothetical protein